MNAPDKCLVDDLLGFERDVRSGTYCEVSERLDLADLLKRARLEILRLRDPND
jgi:hypothetical protein